MDLVRFGSKLGIAVASAAMLVGMVGLQPALAANGTEPSGHHSTPSVFATIETPTWSGDGKTVTYTIDVANVGGATANTIDLTVPLAANTRVVNATVSNGQGRVTNQSMADLYVSLDPMGSLDKRQITLSFAAPAGLVGTSPLAGPVMVDWHNRQVVSGVSKDVDNGTSMSNSPTATPGATPYQLAVSNSTAQEFGFSGTAFVPSEPVTFWLNRPDGAAIPLYIDNGMLTIQSTRTNDRLSTSSHKVVEHLSGSVQTDPTGKLKIMLDDSGLTGGMYSLVARGYASGITAVGSFMVP